MATGIVTPSKKYVAIQYTPTTTKLACVICGKKEQTDKYRVKLFKNENKSEACLLIEKLLNVQISQSQSVNSVCQNCFRSCTTTEAKLQSYRQSYRKTLQSLQQSHGRLSKKRLPFEASQDHEAKIQRIKAITEPATSLEDKRSSTQEDSLDMAVNTVADTIHQELKKLCAKDTVTLLKPRSNEDLSTFSWQKVSRELEQEAPTFWKVLQKCSMNPRQKEKNKTKTEDSILPGLASAACKIVHMYNRDMNVVQKLNSLVLLRGGAKKSVFRRLNSTYDCMSHISTLSMAEKLGENWESDIMKWVSQVDEDTRVEKQLCSNMDELEQTAVFSDDPLESIKYLFEVSSLKKDLDNHRQFMHSGYYFVGDNVDMRTSVRQMTLKNQNKDHHMFQICAFNTRVAGNSLDSSKPKADIATVEFKTFVPSVEEQKIISEEFAFLIAKEWAENIAHFAPYKYVIPEHIEHPYMRDTAKRSEKINLGVLTKNEQYNEDMTDICAFLNQYVPGDADSMDQPPTILSGGDYLTFERHKQAQYAKRNDRTPKKRMEGLIPKMEEFHNQAEFLQVIWRILYSTSSAKDTGTLYAARNTVNAKNVSKDPSANYYACSELVDKFTRAYILSAALHYFKMDSMESAPTIHVYNGAIGNESEMRDHILQHANIVFKQLMSFETPKIPSSGYENNTIMCLYCGRWYQEVETLRRHERNIHNVTSEEECPQKPNSSCSEEDFVLNYSKTILTLGLMKMNHDNAIRLGDGQRIMRMNKVFYLFYKELNCSKYAYGMLETLLQANVLLSERDAHRLVWNRTVNNSGKVDTNLPNDLEIEHMNKIFKDEAHSYRGKFTEKVVSRVSRSGLKTEAILKNFDKMSEVKRPSGHHSPGDVSCDIATLVQTFSDQRLFKRIPGRNHSAFPTFKSSLLSLDMKNFRDWLSRSMRKIAKKHFYKY